MYFRHFGQRCVLRSFFLFDELHEGVSRSSFAKQFSVIVGVDGCYTSSDFAWDATIAVATAVVVVGARARIVVFAPKVKTGDHVFACFVFICVKDLFK